MLHRWYLIVLLALAKFTGYTVVTKYDDEQKVEKVQQTDRPIVGVLVSQIERSFDQQWPKKYESYIGASYVKFVEGTILCDFGFVENGI